MEGRESSVNMRVMDSCLRGVRELSDYMQRRESGVNMQQRESSARGGRESNVSHGREGV